MKNFLMNVVILHTVPVLLLISSCNHKESPHGLEPDTSLKTEVISLPSGEGDTLKASFFADTVEYIQLESSMNSIIGNYKQIWIDDEYILINQFTKLSQFSRNGKFIRHIGSRGRGPGEYDMIDDFDVIRDTIYISAVGNKTIIKYTLNGDFCGEIKVKESIMYMSSTFDGYFAYYDYSKGTVLICDDEIFCLDTIRVEYGLSNGRYRYTLSDPTFMTYFQKTESGLLFTDYLSDTIWRVERGGKYPQYVIDMDDDFLPRDKHVEFSNGDFERWGKMANEYKKMHTIPFASHIFVFQKGWYTGRIGAIYHANRKLNSFKKYKPFIYDDLVGGLVLRGILFNPNDNNCLVSVLDAHDIHEQLNSINGEFVNQMSQANSDDNPIIVVFKLKNNG